LAFWQPYIGQAVGGVLDFMVQFGGAEEWAHPLFRFFKVGGGCFLYALPYVFHKPILKLAEI
jgi:hypothetical protein